MRKRKSLKALLLLFALLLSPLTCCGGTYILDMLPSSIVPPAADFMVNLFEGEIRVKNGTEETLYITPITTTTGKPVVIRQISSIRQRDFPVKPGQSLRLTYDMADAPLAGIAICRTSDDCRLLTTDYADEYDLDGYEDLPVLEQEWLAAIQSSPKQSLSVVIYPILGLVPAMLFLSWVYLIIQERETEAN